MACLSHNPTIDTRNPKSMTFDAFYDFCTSLPNTSEAFPFDETTLVLKVQNKMFALCDIDKFESINLKCDPVEALELRERYPEIVIPGYHMNKKHWNTIVMGDGLPENLVKEWIRNSYDLVIAGIPKSKRL